MIELGWLFPVHLLTKEELTNEIQFKLNIIFIFHFSLSVLTFYKQKYTEAHTSLHTHFTICKKSLRHKNVI